MGAVHTTLFEGRPGSNNSTGQRKEGSDGIERCPPVDQLLRRFSLGHIVLNSLIRKTPLLELVGLFMKFLVGRLYQ